MSTTSGALGPVEWIAISFSGGVLDPAVVPPLAALVEAGTVRVLDAAVVHKGPDGTVLSHDRIAPEAVERALRAVDPEGAHA